MENTQYLHPILEDKAQKGYEPAVIRQMEHELLKEVSSTMRRNGISPNDLATPEMRAATIDGVFKSMIGLGNLQVKQFKGFDDMYEKTRATMTQWPAEVAIREVKASSQAVQAARKAITDEMEEEFTMRVNRALEARYTNHVIEADSLARVLDKSHPEKAKELRAAYQPAGHNDSLAHRALEAAADINDGVQHRQRAQMGGARPGGPR